MRIFFVSICLLFLSVSARAEIVVAWAGQSLCKAMFTDNSIPVTPAPDTYLWNETTGTWGQVTGTGAREYANMLRAQSGQPVYMLNGCKDGSPLLAYHADPSTPTFYWMSQTGASPLIALRDQVNASGKKPTILQWHQGQSDYFTCTGSVYFDYFNGLTWLYAYYLSEWGLTSTQMPMNVWISGRATFGTSKCVNAAQLEVARTLPGARLGTAYYDLAYVDGTHLDITSYRLTGDRQARLDLKALGVPGFECSATPRITGAWRINNSLVEVITDSPCGLHTHPWVSYLTGWDVWNADYSWHVPITGAWLAGSVHGTSVFLQLAAPTAPFLWVHFWYDQYRDPSAPAFANDTSLGVNGNPVAPLPFGFQTPN